MNRAFCTSPTNMVIFSLSLLALAALTTAKPVSNSLSQHGGKSARFQNVPIMRRNHVRKSDRSSIKGRASEDDASESSNSLLVGGSGYITTVNFDGQNFSVVSNLSTSTNPSWLAFDETKSLVYANDENANLTSVLQFDYASGNLTEVQAVNGSLGVVHLEFNGDGSELLGAGYSTGTVDVWAVDNTTGQLTMSNTLVWQGQNQFNPYGTSHVHQTVYGGEYHDFFIANDLGTDSIFLIGRDGDAEAILNSTQTPKGCGPRHGAIFDPLQGYPAYYMVVCEDSSQILTYEIDNDNTTGPVLSSAPISALPSYGYDSVPANLSSTAGGELLLLMRETNMTISGCGSNSTSTEVRRDVEDGSNIVADIYVTNRITGSESDTIAHFVIESEDGPDGPTFSLGYMDYVNSSGVHPRSINLSGDQQVLFGGNVMSGSSLFAFARDPTTGSLASEPLATMDEAALGATGPAFVREWINPAN
jgi:6-phosphogluconolactonase (cycloisomerase 2 family)